MHFKQFSTSLPLSILTHTTSYNTFLETKCFLRYILLTQLQIHSNKNGYKREQSVIYRQTNSNIPLFFRL